MLESAGCGEPVINLLNGSLVFGGPSLLAVVQLLQITLHVEHLLLRDKKKDLLFRLISHVTMTTSYFVSGVLSDNQNMEPTPKPPEQKETG